MSKKPFTVKRIIGETLKTLVLGVALFHGVSFLYNSGRDLKDKINPPTEYISFEKTTGIKIGGYKDKYLNDNLFIFSSVLREEQIKPQELHKIIIDSPNYFNKTFFGQLSETIFTGFSGYYSPITNSIIMNGVSASTLSHELAHARTYDVKNKRDLLKEWSKLACDKNGKSYYMNSGQQILSRIRLLEKLIEPKSNNSEKNNITNLGFVSSYAATNVYEDIAEFVSSVYNNMYDFSVKYNSNPILEKKLNLAVKYNLLPKESLEYSNVMSLFEQWNDWRETISNSINNSKIQKDTKKVVSEFSFENYLLSRDSLHNRFLVESEKFLQYNPDSRFANNVYNYRALAYAQGSFMGTSWSKDSEIELKRALTLKNKGTEYEITLSRLSECYEQLHHTYGENNSYTCALKEYTQRRDNCDTLLFSVGVNDVLVKMGELKSISK